MIDADTLVVGLGIHGSSAARALARRGARVIGIDRFERGTTRGSSHGATRMIRRAYPNPLWNPLLQRAFEGWAEWESDSGLTLLHETGGLFAHEGESHLQGEGTVRLSDSDELSARMPGFRVPSGFAAVYDPAAGVLEAALGLDYARDSAAAAGADLRFGTLMTGWEQTGEGVRVQTSEGELLVGSLVLTAGSWVSAAVPALAGLFEVWRIVTVSVRAGQEAGIPPALGAFSVDRPDGLAFGIPDVGHGLKLGLDRRDPWNPDVPPAPPTDEEIDERLGLLAEYVPGIETELLEATACLYTMTEDKRFVIGALPSADRVVVAAACSGHGFKFGPAIGEAAADLALGTTRPDLDFVGFERRGVRA